MAVNFVILVLAVSLSWLAWSMVVCSVKFSAKLLHYWTFAFWPYKFWSIDAQPELTIKS